MSATTAHRKPATKRARAFSLTELLVIVATLAIVLLVFLVPQRRNDPMAPGISCANSLKQIGLSFRTWAIDNDGHSPMQVSVANGGAMELVASGQVFPQFLVMSNELTTPKVLYCPDDKQRTNATSFASGLSDQNISYFLNVDAIPDNGTNLLCGDRNLINQRLAGSRFVLIGNGARIGWTKEIHSKQGSLCFGDGHVVREFNGGPLTTVRLPEGVTNRLAIP
jgi:hypothetical protein